jgi:hypothetical protein
MPLQPLAKLEYLFYYNREGIRPPMTLGSENPAIRPRLYVVLFRLVHRLKDHFQLATQERVPAYNTYNGNSAYYTYNGYNTFRVPQVPQIPVVPFVHRVQQVWPVRQINRSNATELSHRLAASAFRARRSRAGIALGNSLIVTKGTPSRRFLPAMHLIDNTDNVDNADNSDNTNNAQRRMYPIGSPESCLPQKSLESRVSLVSRVPQGSLICRISRVRKDLLSARLYILSRLI